MNERNVDLAVVGAGLGGLVLAARAQRAGRSVLVLEQGAVAGGLGRSTSWGGVPMNLGPHALYLDGPAERALLELGLSLDGFEPGAGAFLELDGALVAMPSSPLALLTAGWLSWRERAELALTLRGLRDDAPNGTTAQWLATLRSPRVRAFMEAMVRVTTYTNAPEALSTRLAWNQLRSLVTPGARGVRYLDGGWQSLVDVLSQRVSIRFNARVQHVTPDGVLTLEGGECLRATEVALAVPLAAAARLTDDAALKQRVASAVPVRAACLDVVLHALPKPERRLVLGTHEPLYFSVHSRPDVTGPIKVHVAKYLRPDDTTDAAGLERTLTDFLERVQPGWRGVSAGHRFFPHLRVMEDLPREEPTQLAAPLRLVSSVAGSGFLFDGIIGTLPTYENEARVGQR